MQQSVLLLRQDALENLQNRPDREVCQAALERDSSLSSVRKVQLEVRVASITDPNESIADDLELLGQQL